MTNLRLVAAAVAVVVLSVPSAALASPISIGPDPSTDPAAGEPPAGESSQQLPDICVSSNYLPGLVICVPLPNVD